MVTVDGLSTACHGGANVRGPTRPTRAARPVNQEPTHNVGLRTGCVGVCGQSRRAPLSSSAVLPHGSAARPTCRPVAPKPACETGEYTKPPISRATEWYSKPHGARPTRPKDTTRSPRHHHLGDAQAMAVGKNKRLSKGKKGKGKKT